MTAPTGTVYRAALLVACWATAFGGLAGCSEEPGRAGTLPSRTASPTPTTTSASPTPTTVEEQVEAAVRAYYAELTRAAQTNDTTRLKTMVTRGCPCYRPVRVIERGARRGESTPDARWTIRTLRVHDIVGETALVEVRYDVSAYDVVDRSGKVLAHIGKQTSHFDLSLVKGDRGWVIGNLMDLEG